MKEVDSVARKNILERKDEIIEWINQNQSKTFISKELHCKQSTLNSYLAKMGIQYGGNPGSKNKKNQCRKI